MIVTPNVTNVKQGDTVKVTVQVSKNGTPVSAATGIYEANNQIPTTSSGGGGGGGSVPSGEEFKNIELKK
jgi:hypothetical protein